MSLLTVERYEIITGDTGGAASAVSARIEDAEELLADFLDRPLAEAEQTETLLPDSQGRLWPRATPISDSGDYQVEGLALLSTPFGFSTFLGGETGVTVTYTGGWTTDTLPAYVERDLAWATYRLLHPSTSLASLPPGVTSARLGDAALTWDGPAPSLGSTDGWWSVRTRGHRYRPVHSGPILTRPGL